MEVVAGDGEGIDFGIGDLDALGVIGSVDFTSDLETGLGGGCGDQFDDGQPAGQSRWPHAGLVDLTAGELLG